MAVILAISVTVAAMVFAKMKSGKKLFLSLSSTLLPFLLFFLTAPNKVRYIWDALSNSTERVYTHVCLEEDPVWASITLTCIQLPAVVLAFCFAVGVMLLKCGEQSKYAEGYTRKVLAGCLLLLVVPFPVVVFVQQVTSLFMPDHAQMELLSSMLLFGEGALEASTQLLLLLYIIVSDSERDIPWIQRASITSSMLTISKTAIELFVSESYYGATPEDVLYHEYTCRDSILNGNLLLRKLWIMAQLSPAFILSLMFKVGSITVICAFLKVYAVIYIALGIVITFIVAYKCYVNDNTDEKAGTALFYSLTNVTILSKCPLKNRAVNYKQMMPVSITWMILHTAILVCLMVWVGILPESTHLDHWSEHRFALIQATAFYPTVIGIVLLGPLSIIALWGLKKQVLAFEEKEEGGRKFWDPPFCNPDPAGMVQ